MTRVLLIGRSDDREQRVKLDVLAAELDVQALPFRAGRNHGIADYALLPVRVARVLRSFQPDAVLVQGAHETAATLLGRRLAGSRAKVILDIHGDWRAPTRLYGSGLRRLLSPLADAVARVALQRADAVRSVTPYTSRLLRAEGVEPADEFAAFMQLEPFLAEPPGPLPEQPQALFVGALEPTKGVDVLLRAWEGVQQGELRLVGDGSLRSLVDGRSWTPWLPQAEVAQALDESWCLVLPSRSEGMGRVVVEAFCRGRAVVGTTVGGIPDLVQHGVNGLLVPPEDPEALARALERVLSQRGLAWHLGERARLSADRFVVSPEEFARRLRDLVERVVH